VAPATSVCELAVHMLPKPTFASQIPGCAALAAPAIVPASAAKITRDVAGAQNSNEKNFRVISHSWIPMETGAAAAGCCLTPASALTGIAKPKNNLTLTKH